MSKRLTADQIDDTPFPWQAFVDEIDELRASGRCDWADDILRGIQTTVRTYHSVTAGQRRAIDNIRVAGDRDRTERRGSLRGRRYEGWERS